MLKNRDLSLTSGTGGVMYQIITFDTSKKLNRLFSVSTDLNSSILSKGYPEKDALCLFKATLNE